MNENGLPELPKGWVRVPVGDAVHNIPLTGNKIKQRDYQLEGSLPVIDQGQQFIGGYTDRHEMKVDCNLPVVIFGDHTKVFKYVNFAFAAGADGIKVLRPFEAFDPGLFYYFVQALTLPEKGYARHYQFLEKSLVGRLFRHLPW